MALPSALGQTGQLGVVTDHVIGCGTDVAASHLAAQAAVVAVFKIDVRGLRALNEEKYGRSKFRISFNYVCAKA